MSHQVPITKEEIRQKLDTQIRYGVLAEKAKYAMDMYEHYLAQHLYYINQMNKCAPKTETIVPAREGLYVPVPMPQNETPNGSTNIIKHNTQSNGMFKHDKPVPNFIAKSSGGKSMFQPPPAPKKDMNSRTPIEPSVDVRKNLNNVFNKV